MWQIESKRNGWIFFMLNEEMDRLIDQDVLFSRNFFLYTMKQNPIENLFIFNFVKPRSFGMRTLPFLILRVNIIHIHSHRIASQQRHKFHEYENWKFSTKINKSNPISIWIFSWKHLPLSFCVYQFYYDECVILFSFGRQTILFAAYRVSQYARANHNRHQHRSNYIQMW